MVLVFSDFGRKEGSRRLGFGGGPETVNISITSMDDVGAGVGGGGAGAGTAGNTGRIEREGGSGSRGGRGAGALDDSERILVDGTGMETMEGSGSGSIGSGSVLMGSKTRMESEAKRTI